MRYLKQIITDTLNHCQSLWSLYLRIQGGNPNWAASQEVDEQKGWSATIEKVWDVFFIWNIHKISFINVANLTEKRYRRWLQTNTELEYIPGLPLLHNKRLIQVSRFQTINSIDLPLVEENLQRQTFNNKYSVELVLVSDIIEQIYELSISWTPELLDTR